MRKLLLVVLILFALLVVDSVYLGAITFLQWTQGENLENAVFQFVFLAHLALGVTIVVPAIVFATMHLRRAIGRRNRLAVRLGLSLFATLLALLASGILLTRGIPFFELQHPVADGDQFVVGDKRVPHFGLPIELLLQRVQPCVGAYRHKRVFFEFLSRAEGELW